MFYSYNPRFVLKRLNLSHRGFQTGHSETNKAISISEYELPRIGRLNNHSRRQIGI